MESKIFYTGIGARDNFLHTPEQFMKAMQNPSLHAPKGLSVSQMMMWAGAVLVFLCDRHPNELCYTTPCRACVAKI